MAASAAGGIAAATKSAADFEATMADVEKVTDAGTAAELEGQFMGLAETIPISREELVKLGEQAGKFGAEGTAEIETFVRSIGKIQTATDLAAREAGKRFAKIAGAVGVPLGEIDKLGNATNALADSMKTNAAEITDTATRASNVLSQQFGLSEDAVLSLSASLNEVSPSSRRAAGSLRRAAEALMDPKKVEDIASAIGIQTNKFRQLREENPQQLLRMVAEAMASGGQQARELSAVLGKRASRAFSKLGSQTERTDEAMQLVNKQFEDGTSLAREMSIRTDTAAGQWQLFKNEVMNVATTIGQQFLPYAKDALDVLRDVTGAFADLNERTNGFAGAAALVTGLVGGIVTALGGLYGVVTSSAVAMGGLSGALGAVTAALSALTGPIGLVVSALAGLALAATGHLDTVINAFNSFRDTVDKAIGGAATWLRTTGVKLVGKAFRLIGEAIRGALEDVLKALRGDDDSIIGSAISEVVSYLRTDAAGDLAEAATIAFELLLAGVEGVLQGLTGSDSDASIQAMLEAVAQWLRTDGVALLSDAAGAAFDAVIDAGKDLVTRLISAGDSVFRSLISAITTYLEDQAAEDIKAAFRALGSGIRETLLEFFQLQTKLGTVITDFIGAVKDYIAGGQAAEDIKAAFRALGSGIRAVLLGYFQLNKKLGQVIVDFFGAVKEYIASGQAAEDIKGAFRALGSGIRTVLLGYFQLQKKLGQVIKDFIGAVYDYIASGQALEDMKKAFGLLSEGVKTVLEKWFQLNKKLGQVIKDFFGAVKEYVEGGEGFKDLKTAFGALAGMIKAAFVGLFEGLFYGSIIKDFFSDVAGYVGRGGEGFKKIKGAFQTLAGAIESALNSISIDWPEPPERVKRWMNGNFDTPSSPDRDDSARGSARAGPGGGGGGGGGGQIAAFQHGGYTRAEGWGYLHPNEVVFGVEAGAEAIVDAMEGAGAPQLVVEEGAIQVDGAGDPEEVAREVLRQLDRKRRRLYPDG